MSIKDKIKKTFDVKDTDQIPDEFEPEKQVEKTDEELKEFVEETIEGHEDKTKKPKEKKEETSEIEEQIETEEKPTTPEKQSTFSTQMNIQLDIENATKTKEIIKDAVNKGYIAAISAEKAITKENVDQVNKILDYLAKHKYDTIIVAKKTEAVFNE